MHKIIILLSSNYNSVFYMAQAMRRLGQVLLDVKFTRPIWTPPLNSSLPLLYENQLLKATTSLTLDDLQTLLKHIEQQMGRSDEDRRRDIVRIDIDLMLFDENRLHLNDWEQEYFKQLYEQL